MTSEARGLELGLPDHSSRIGDILNESFLCHIHVAWIALASHVVNKAF